SVNHLLFQLEQFRSRFDDNAREAKVLVRYVVVFESFQLQASHIGAGEDFADGGIDFIEILGEDETLHQADVGTMGGVEREPLRKDLAQTLVGGGRVLEHRGVRFQKDVDSGDSVRVGFGSRRLGGLGGGAAGVRSSICWSPSEFPNAAMGRRPMCELMPTGLPVLSSMKFISGNRMSTGLPSRHSYFVLMLLPTTCSGGMP